MKSHFTIKQRLALSSWSDCFERLVLDMDTAVRDSTFSSRFAFIALKSVTAG